MQISHESLRRTAKAIEIHRVRADAWKFGSLVLARFPIAGSGLNTYGIAMLFYQRHDLAQHYAQAHNDYLQLVGEGGALVVLPALASVAAFTIAVRRRFKSEMSATAFWLRVGAVTGLVAIAVQEIVDFSLQMPGNTILFAVLCAIALHHAPETGARHVHTSSRRVQTNAALPKL